VASAARVAGARELAVLRANAIKLAGVEMERDMPGRPPSGAGAIGAIDHKIAEIAPVAPPQDRDPLAFMDAWRVKRNETLTLVDTLQVLGELERHAEATQARARTPERGFARRGRYTGPGQRSRGADRSGGNALGVEIHSAALRQKAEERRAEAARAEAKFNIAKEADASWRQPGARHALAPGLARPVASRRSRGQAVAEKRLRNCARR